MATIEDRLDEEILQCSVCLENFEDPRILPCGHSFCLKCIQESCRAGRENHEFEYYGLLDEPLLMDPGGIIPLMERPLELDITCPICRGQFRANPVGLPVSRTIANIQDIRMKRPAPDGRLPRRHISEVEMCPDHPDTVLKVLCVRCQQIVCYQCLDDGEHKGHERERNVTELYNKTVQEIDTGLNQLQVNINQLETASDQLLTMEETVNRAGGAMKQEIDIQADDIITRVTNRRRELKAMVDREVEGKMMDIRQQRDTVRQHSKKVTQTRVEIINKLKEWDKAKVIVNKQNLQHGGDACTPKLVKGVHRTKSELNIAFKRKQNDKKIMLGQIFKMSGKSKMWQMYSWRHIMLATLVIAVILNFFSPFLCLVIMALITLYATLEYNHTDRSIMVRERLEYDIPETLSECLKLFAVVAGIFTVALLFYSFTWLYFIVCVVGFLHQYWPINIPPFFSKNWKVFSAVIGAATVVFLYHFITYYFNQLCPERPAVYYTCEDTLFDTLFENA